MPLCIEISTCRKSSTFLNYRSFSCVISAIVSFKTLDVYIHLYNTASQERILN